MNSKTYLVGLREYKSTVMTKAFILGAIVLPLVIWGLAIAIPLLVKDEIPTMKGTIVIVDETGMVGYEFASSARHEFLKTQREELSKINIDEYVNKTVGGAVGSQGGLARDIAVMAGKRQLESLIDRPLHELTFEHLDASADFEALKQRVRSGQLLAVIHLKKDALTTQTAWVSELIRKATAKAIRRLRGGEDEKGQPPAAPEVAEAEVQAQEPRIFLYTDRAMHADNIGFITQTLSAAVAKLKMALYEVDPLRVQQAMTPPDISVKNLTETGEVKSSEAANMLVPLAFMMLLWISTFTGGQYLLTTTIEEKSSKVIEVLLSATSPMQLMTGKILGQGAVALTMLLMYAALAIGALAQFNMSHLFEPA